MNDIEKYRPPVEDRWIDGMRQVPVRIEVRTEFLYSKACPPETIAPPASKPPRTKS